MAVPELIAGLGRGRRRRRGLAFAAANKPIEMVSQVAPASGKLLIGHGGQSGPVSAPPGDIYCVPPRSFLIASTRSPTVWSCSGQLSFELYGKLHVEFLFE